MILPFNSALVRALLECCVCCWAPQCKKRYGVCGKSAANGHENVEGIGASSVRREVERAGTVYINVYRHLTWERTKEDGDRIFSLVSSDRTRVKGTSCNVGNSM